MKRLLSIVMLAALVAITAHAGPLLVDGGRVSPLSSIESIGTLEIHLKIRIVPDSTPGRGVVVVDDDMNRTLNGSISAAQTVVTSRRTGNRSTIEGVRGGFAILRALRCAAGATLDYLVSYANGN